MEEEAQKHQGRDRPALFLVDGDLDWVAGDHPIHVPGLFRLEGYSIENFLVSEVAAIEIVVDTSGVMDRATAKARLGWAGFRQQVLDVLLDVFVLFAVAHTHKLGVQTVGRGIGCVCVQHVRRAQPSLDRAKSQQLLQDLEREIVGFIGQDTFDQGRAQVAERVRQLEDPLRAVSGKDFLVPLVHFRVTAASGGRVDRRSLLFRLAKYADLLPLEPLKRALHAAARGNAA